MRKRVRVAPRHGGGFLIDAWRLEFESEVFRFIRPEAAAELCEERGLSGPTPQQVHAARRSEQRGRGWRLSFAPITDIDFLDLPMG